MKNLKYNFAVSLIAGTGLFYVVLQRYGFYETVAVIRQAGVGYLPAAGFLLVASYVLRGYRWMIWERGLRFWDSFGMILTGFMGNNILPTRLGEFLRGCITAEKQKEHSDKTAALASIMVERILDGFMLSVFGIVGLSLVPLDGFLYGALMFFSVMFAALTVGLIAGVGFHKKTRRTLENINRRFPGHLTKYWKEKFGFFLDSLLLVKNFSRIILAMAATIFIWGIELSVYYLIANSVYVPVPIATCLIFAAAVNFASLFPFTIGGIGAIEGAAALFLVSSGIPPTESLAMVIIHHGLQYLFTTSAGGFFYFTGGYYKISFMPVIPKVESKHPEETCTKPADDLFGKTRAKLDELSSGLGKAARTPKDIALSIVIPSYNERNRLPVTMLETIRWGDRNGLSYEIIVVDDGSRDDTLEIAKLFYEFGDNIRVIACPHLGKGAAVRIGMLNAEGSYVLFMDADGATPLDEIPKLISKIDEGCMAAIGSRSIQVPGETVVVSSLHRKIIGRIFAALVNIIAIPGIADSQCGFKMFKKEIIKKIFSRQKLNGYAFDVEILYLAKKLDLSVAEVPVNWTNKDGSKVNIVSDSARMLVDILKIPFLHKDFK